MEGRAAAATRAVRVEKRLRPAGERTAAGRYQEPTLFAKMTRMKALASASVAKSSGSARLSSDPAFERTTTSPMQKWAENYERADRLSRSAAIHVPQSTK
jgi:hypothetical protein